MGLKGSVRLPSQRQWDGGRWEEGRMADRGALLERVKGGGLCRWGRARRSMSVTVKLRAVRQAEALL